MLTSGARHGSYLQGMETVITKVGVGATIGTDPTYKEWKLWSHARTLAHTLGHGSYLQGMETFFAPTSNGAS